MRTTLSAAAASAPGIHVLVVDDSEDDGEWLTRCIREARLRCSVTQARSIDEALAALEQDPRPDIVLSDYRLLDGSGLELADRLRGVVPVVIVTGEEQPGLTASMFTRGAVDFLLKDEVRSDVVGRVIENALVRHRLEQQVHDARDAAERALADERALNARMSALLDLTTGLSAASTTAELASFVASRLGPMLGAATVSVYSVEGDVLVLRGEHAVAPEVTERWRTIPLAASTLLATAARTGVLSHATSAQLALQYDGIPPDRTWLAVPIRDDSRALAVLGLSFEDSVKAIDGELDYLLIVAGVIGQAARRARLLERARESADFEERLLAVLGHDLRSPLEVIALGIGLLRTRGATESTLASLDRATARMSGLITDILARAAARRGAGDRSVIERAVGEVVLQQVAELREAQPDRTILLELGPDLDCACDSVRVAQIVTNLVRNAQTHGTPGHPVEVRVERDLEEIRLVVSNHGTVPEEIRRRMFEPFIRGRRSSGTGLGLFIVQEAVTAMGGTIAVRSDDHTTQFVVVVPARRPEAPHPPS